MQWFEVQSAGQIDSPALLIYRDRVEQNLREALRLVRDPNRLRPHVKTHKMPAVCRLMLDAGLRHFKCATIAEAEMLALCQAPDVLLAYQPVGPKQERLLTLCERFPATTFGCLIDDLSVAHSLSKAYQQHHLTLQVYLDVNTGQNRTGTVPDRILALYLAVKKLPGLRFAGLHVYDGHIRDQDPALRQQHSDAALQPVFKLSATIEQHETGPVQWVLGGSPTFNTHCRRNAQCSPGTFIFWDDGYQRLVPDQPFQPAALVLSRVISVVNAHTVTADLGHKAVAAETPLPRVRFLNRPEAEPIAHSEEHLVLRVPDSRTYPPGTALYGIPWHICPTVALYNHAEVIHDHQVVDRWEVLARTRQLSV